MICQATPEDKMIMELLLRKGAVINDPAAPAGRQALHLAALANNCELIEILLSLGADIFATTQLNETARDIAVYFRCKEAEMLLAEKEYDMMLLYEREKGSFQPRGSAYNKDSVRFSVHSAMTESFFGLSKRASTDKEYGSSSKGAESTIPKALSGKGSVLFHKAINSQEPGSSMPKEDEPSTRGSTRVRYRTIDLARKS